MNFQDAVKHVYSNYIKFDGRALRSEYWYFVLFYFIAGVILSILSGILGMPGALDGLFYLASFLPFLGVAVRRLHDSGMSGWWVLIPLTIIGIIPYLYWVIREGDQGDNAYGPPAPTSA